MHVIVFLRGGSAPRLGCRVGLLPPVSVSVSSDCSQLVCSPESQLEYVASKNLLLHPVLNDLVTHDVRYMLLIAVQKKMPREMLPLFSTKILAEL